MGLKTKDFLLHCLMHPRMRGIPLCDPAHAATYRAQILRKPFLKQIYTEWYELLSTHIPADNGQALELGKGGGFLKTHIPDLITSERVPVPDADIVADAQNLPFPDASLRAILMTDVLHHITDPARFLTEATRCVRSGGAIAMIEPWVNPWSILIYRHLHHEPFEPNAPNWQLPEGADSANGAIPWMILIRDRARFHHEFPEWEIRHIRPLMPLTYVLSGGLAMCALMPGWSYKLWRTLERPLERHTGLFAHIVLIRK